MCSGSACLSCAFTVNEHGTPPDTRLYSYAVISSMEGGPSLAEMWWPLPMLTKSAAFVR